MRHGWKALGLLGVLLAFSVMFLWASPSQGEHLVVRTMDGNGLLQADFTHSIRLNTVSFHDNSTGTITSWSWTFGDGTGSNVSDPMHKYARAETYLITLTVAGQSGMVSTATAMVKVEHIENALAVLLPVLVLALGGILAIAVKNPYVRLAIIASVLTFILLYFAGFFDALQIAGGL